MSTHRLFFLMIGSMLAAGSALPQPAPAPVPPAPPVAPAPPAPVAAPVPAFHLDLPSLHFDFPFDFAGLGAGLGAAAGAGDFNFGPDWPDAFPQIAQAEQYRGLADQIRAQVRAQQVDQFPFGPRGPRGGRGPGRGDDGQYSAGQRALDRSQWDEALANFNRVVSNAGPRAEGALYWKAYTLNKLGRRDEARAAIADLRKSYPMSRWLDDANALDMEIQQAAGQPVSPENQTDEELKLMAVNALVRTDPDRAFPLLENLLKSAQTPRLKQRALFVLSQTDAPRSQQLLEQVARGGGNPDLQVTAINYLGATARRKGNTQPLYDIYTASNDTNVKRSILQALRSADDTDHIVQAVKAEKNAELRAEGIRMLGSKASAGDALVGIWGTEQDEQVKYAILDSLNGERNAKALVDLARKERDPQMKKEIVRRLSNMQSKEATDYLMELLK